MLSSAMLMGNLLAVVLIGVTGPAWAQDKTHPFAGGERPLVMDAFDSRLARDFVENLVLRGLDLIDDHIEFDSSIKPESLSGERSAHLRLKLYPQGKRRSEEGINAETWFRLSPSERRFHFDLRLSPPPSRQERRHPPDEIL